MRVSRLFFCRFAGIRLAGRIKYGREDKKWIKKSLVFSFPIESGDEGRSQVEKIVPKSVPDWFLTAECSTKTIRAFQE